MPAALLLIRVCPWLSGSVRVAQSLLVSRSVSAFGKQSPSRAARTGGFALLLVLWTLVLLGLVVTHIIASGRGEVRIATNLRANAGAEARADGAIYEALYRLVDVSGVHWAADGIPHVLDFKDAKVSVRVVPLVAKVNPNFASVPLLAGVLEAAGADPDKADALAQAIADWRGRDSWQSPLTQRLAPYRTAGLDDGPPGTPIESLDELGHVLGMTPALLRAVKPSLSLYQMGPPDPSSAEPAVAQALRHLPATPASPSPETDAAPLPPQASTQTVTVEAVAVTADGARFSRHAVVRVGPVFPRGYIILAWGGEQDED